ncbi:MAG: DUF3047 domain-containing protein [Candidatus Rokubacteria bacterium]|nr:DUF3047 domain-containing protein [Candidatus Rokubacteria bacterium]
MVAPGPLGAPGPSLSPRHRRGVRLLGLALLALLASPAVAGAAGGCVAVDDFSTAKLGVFPAAWRPRDDAAREVYTVEEEPGRRFLRARSRGLGVQAARPFEWDLAAYPVLSWQWRPLRFPAGSDERVARTNDSALAVYAVFPHTPVSVKSLKYIWSAVVSAGEQLSSSNGLTRVRVLRNGARGQGKWLEERVNVLEDYRSLFKEAEVPKPAGIAVLTDSDDTQSSAQGDYARFRVCRP